MLHFYYVCELKHILSLRNSPYKPGYFVFGAHIKCRTVYKQSAIKDQHIELFIKLYFV